jgi:ABC-type molybdate transport system substrate-binding protein
LPPEINLGVDALAHHYSLASLQLGDKTYQPQPLLYYAAVLGDSQHHDKAAAFVDWLTHDGQLIFRKYFYDPPGRASPLHA